MKTLKMPIVRPRINSSLYRSILFLLTFFSAVVLYINQDIFTQDLDYKDPTSLLLLCFVVVTIIVFASVIRVLLLFGFEDFWRDDTVLVAFISNLFKRVSKYLIANEYLCFFMCMDLVCGASCLYLDLKLNIDHFLAIISSSMLGACMLLLSDYDYVDLCSLQNMEKSIGASWAYGAYSAFYKKILVDITSRMSKFEEKNNIALLVKKLVIICPLSCNANGSLDGKGENITCKGSLKEITDDEGANNNRSLKTNVYKICDPFESYIAAEIPSPLATLYEMRDAMDAVVLEYHRKCFIETLKNLTKSYQRIILEYDDLNSPEPLHSFLLSKLENRQRKKLSV